MGMTICFRCRERQRGSGLRFSILINLRRTALGDLTVVDRTFLFPACKPNVFSRKVYGTSISCAVIPELEDRIDSVEADGLVDQL